MSEASIGDLRRRALNGVALVAARGLVLRALAFGGNVWLAHLVAPGDFGKAAFALALVSVGRFLADGGMGAALIRGKDDPAAEDVSACAGAQVLLTLALVAATTSLLLPGKEVLLLTWVASLSLPLVALRTSSLVILERRLDYRPVVVAETAEVALGFVVSIAVALSGAGALGIAIGSVAGAAAGTAILPLLAPGTWKRPSVDLRRVRRLLGFSAAYQSIGAMNLVRDEGINLGLFLISGAPVLGLWTLAYRVLQVPFLLFEGLWRVSFPAMARLSAAGQDVRPIVERGVEIAGAWTGLILCVLVGSSPSLVPVVFGTEWSGVTEALPAAGLSLLLGGPVSAAGAGYLFAVGDAARVVRATFVHTVCWLAIGLPLLPVLGVSAISLGWLAGGVAETVLFARGLRQHAGVRVGRPVLVTALPAAVAGALGWVLADWGPPSVTRGLLSAAAAGATYLLGLRALSRRVLVDAVTVVSELRRGAEPQR